MYIEEVGLKKAHNCRKFLWEGNRDFLDFLLEIIFFPGGGEGEGGGGGGSSSMPNERPELTDRGEWKYSYLEKGKRHRGYAWVRANMP